MGTYLTCVPLKLEDENAIGCVLHDMKIDASEDEILDSSNFPPIVNEFDDLDSFFLDSNYTANTEDTGSISSRSSIDDFAQFMEVFELE